MKKLLGYLLVIVGIVIMVDSKLEFFNIPFPYLIGSVVAAVGLGLSAMGGEDSYARFKEQYEAETGDEDVDLEDDTEGPEEIYEDDTEDLSGLYEDDTEKIIIFSEEPETYE